MAADILVTPENLKTEASNLDKNKSSLDSIFNQIAGLISGLISHWHGESQQAFSDSFTSKRAIFDKFSEDMASFSYFMKLYAGNMENQEKTLAGKARSLG